MATELTAQQGFDSAYYLAEKAAALTKSTGQTWTAAQVEIAFAEAGLTPSSHYLLYGYNEGLAPNAFFNKTEYIVSKSAAAGVTPTAFLAAWTAASGSNNVFLHYIQYGSFEDNVNPSAGFNDQAYYEAKAALVGGGTTWQEVRSAIQAAGYNAISHYQTFAAAEGNPYTPTPAPIGGETYTLTTGQDNIVGTAGDDTINGTASDTVAATDTFNAIDTIRGGAGTDTLNLAVTGTTTASTLVAADVAEVELVKVRAVLTTPATLTTVEAPNFVGATDFYADRATSALKFNNLSAGQAVGIIGNGVATNGDVTAAYKNSVTSGVFNIHGGTTAGVLTETGTGITSNTINSTGGANTLTNVVLSGTANTALTINAATSIQTGNITGFTGTASKITVSGAATNVAATATAGEHGAVNLGTIENTTVKTIDASGLTNGGLEAILNTNVAISVKGGAGNDIITTGAVLTTGSVDAGAGTADVLAITAGGTHVASAALGAKYTNFEVLRLADSQDVSFVSGITALQLSGMGAETISKVTATQAANVTVLGNQGGLTFQLADATGSADTVSMNLKSAVAATNVDVVFTALNGVETLNVAATTGTAGTTSDIDFTAADKLTAINLSGTADASVSGINTNAITLVSTSTGAVTIDGNWANASSITLGSGKDTVTLGTGFASYATGANDDTFNGTAAQLNTGANYNTLDGGDGTDTLNITGGGALTIVDNNLSQLTNIEKIVVATTTTNAQSIETGGWFNAAFQTNGVNLTTTATTGNIAIDMTSFKGNATITATTAGTGAGEGGITIQTGSGSDTITVTNAVAGVGAVLSGFAGADTISGSLDADTITGGKDLDVMTGGGSNDTFSFAAGDTGIPTSSTYDVVTDFSTGNTDFVSYTGVSIGTQVGAAGPGVATIGALTGIATFNAADTTLDQHIAAVEAALHTGAGAPTAGAAVIWQEGLNSYLFISDGVAGVGANDVLMQLTSVTAGALTDGGNTLTIA